jgi:TRAP transporter 4TM/12TM fusion protein
MLMAMVSGSGPANVATTGTFTIPLMKKTGYKAADAGAVEAVASTGGMIMPPVMGQAAFLMSQMTGIPYGIIASAAAIPACLYYFCLSGVLYFIARKNRLPIPDKEAIPKLGQVIKSRWYYIAPPATIIYFIFTNHSPQRSVFYALVVSLLVCFIFERKKIKLKDLYGALRKAAVSCGPMASACIMAGVLMSMLNLTGLGLKISTIIAEVSGGSLLIILLLTCLSALILGMGLPASTSYIMLAILLCPAIVSIGVPPLAAHLFVLTFGAMSSITPPVAMSVYVASGIAECGMWECGGRAILFAAAGFLIPFAFCYNQSLLLMDTTFSIILSFVVVLIGLLIIGTVISGWFLRDLHPIARVLLIPCSLSMVFGGKNLLVVAAGFVGFLLIAGVNYIIRKNKTDPDVVHV